MRPSASGFILKEILRSRGFEGQAAKTFLKPDYAGLRDPFGLPDMDKAVRRLVQAQKQQEKVVIYGDYDIDGLCAVTLLHRAFIAFGVKAEVFIPSRFKEGYGLSSASLKKLRKEGADLIVSVDCGTSAVEPINEANKVGLDVIVTDHHEPGPELPSAVAVINPKRADSRYGFSELAGSGVAFKLVQALQTKLKGLNLGQEKWLLDLAAFGTICDVVPLVDENRILASYGLRVWPQTRLIGLRALAQTSGQSLEKVNARTLGFVFGPRLNAAGRIEHAKVALELLQAENTAVALSNAARLEGLNSERRQLQDDIERQASAQAEAGGSPLVVLAAPEWSHGVVGIVAARLMERLAKPVFLAQILPDGTIKGSARSFGGFSVAAALAAVRQLLVSGGGHHAAGGFSLKSSDWQSFIEGLISHHASLDLVDQPNLLRPQPDLTLGTLDDISLELMADLSQLEPYGHGNPEPLFNVAPLHVVSVRRVGHDKSHLKLQLTDVNGKHIDAVMFRAGELEPKGKISATAALSQNDFGGRARVELVIKAWQKL